MPLTAHQLPLFGRGHGGELLVRDAEAAQGRLIDDADAARGDGPHRELRMGREAELSHDEDVERHVERPRDLVGHGYAAARKGEDDHVGTVGILPELGRQLTAGVGSVSVASCHRYSPFAARSRG